MWEHASRRRQELPPEWEEIRLAVLRDAEWMCELGWAGCLVEATDVDHRKRGNDHSRSNLQALCSECHKKKTSREGVEARRKLRARRKRPPERHPGRR
jgi:5-methylcytosine-specific restriction endonuclease McrA